MALEGTETAGQAEAPSRRPRSPARALPAHTLRAASDPTTCKPGAPWSPFSPLTPGGPWRGKGLSLSQRSGGGSRGEGEGRQHLPQAPARFGPGSLATPADPQDPQVPSVQVARALPADTGEGGAKKASTLPSVAPLALQLTVAARPSPTETPSPHCPPREGSCWDLLDSRGLTPATSPGHRASDPVLPS